MAKGMIEGTSLARSRIYSKSEGFTLVELAVALVIVAILAGFAGAEISSWNPGKRLKGAAKELYADLQTARMKAVAQNKEWAVSFDNANNRYSFCWANDNEIDWTDTDTYTCDTPIDLPKDENGVAYVKYGHSTATDDVPVAAPPSPWTDDITYVTPDDAVVFNSRGIGGAGYVYLDYNCPAGRVYCTDSTYAVGTLTSGSIRLRKWDKVASTWN